MKRIGLVVNPIAGMGGRVGLKGTDGVVEEALSKGARPVAPSRTQQMLDHLKEHDSAWKDIYWLTASGSMGADELAAAGMEYDVVYEAPERTTAEDTRRACSAIVEKGADLVVFCGGDGTARDVHSAVGNRVPILGIPSGVKMHSGVFAINPRVGAEVIAEFVDGKLDIVEGEIMDLDEDLYRQGKWNIKLYGLARMPHSPSYIQTGKEMVESVGQEEIIETLAEHIEEEMNLNPDYAFIFGSGSTLSRIAEFLGIEGKTLLGIDIYYNGNLVERDCDEGALLDFLSRHEKAKLLISPIGGQGFILGRGNQQLSPEVIKRIGLDNITVVSTPAKLSTIEKLRVDTDDPDMIELFRNKKYLPVLVGYRYMVMRPVEV